MIESGELFYCSVREICGIGIMENYTDITGIPILKPLY